MAGAYHYALALGSNRRHAHYGAPANVLAAALCALEAAGCEIIAVAKTMHTDPVGPSSRRYANNVALITCDNSHHPTGLLLNLDGNTLQSAKH